MSAAHALTPTRTWKSLPIPQPQPSINYHLRTLEDHRLVEVAGKRKWGGLTERLLVATAASYVVSPEAMGPVATDPGRTADRLSAGYLIALAARVVREVSDLLARARKAGKRLATLSERAIAPEDAGDFLRQPTIHANRMYFIARGPKRRPWFRPSPSGGYHAIECRGDG